MPAPASAFSYFQILPAVVFDILVSNDFPDYLTLIGNTLIVGAGLYAFRQHAGSEVIYAVHHG